MRFLQYAAVITVLISLLSGCQGASRKMQDGYYTAEAQGYDDDGWKDFLTIAVSNNKIVTVEFDARNSRGFVKSWDPDYQRLERKKTGLHHGAYMRTYTSEFLSLQNPARVSVVVGTERQHKVFQLLAEAAIVQAKAKDKAIAVVELP